MTAKLIRIHPRDNVAVAIEDTPAGASLASLIGEGPEPGAALSAVATVETIKKGHKVALAPIEAGAAVIKYGYPIGHATKAIAPGEAVHVQNLKTGLSGTLSYHYEPEQASSAPVASIDDGRTFDGFRRADGEVGIRNEVWIVPTVGCVNEVAKAMAREAAARIPAGSTVGGVHAWPHPYGCSQLGEDHEMTRKALRGLVRHPNAGGVLVLGLGCENNTLASFREMLGDFDPKRVRFLSTQDVPDEIEAAGPILDELIAFAGQATRAPLPVGKLRVGLKCGGSDGLSGITGNPLVGLFSDMLIARGGTTVLTEVPEMFGAETILMNRCASEAVFRKAVAMINGFKEYFQRYGQVVYENPSPGNKAGGITTLEDKSLGCTQKGGGSPVVDVLDYGDWLRKPGLNLLNGPGNDMVAVTVMAAAGAHLILFTTGRGTPLGSVVPTIKISTNSDLATRKAGWIDFNAGVLVEGRAMEEVAEEFFSFVVDVASGRRATVNEARSYREIAIFKDGVTL